MKFISPTNLGLFLPSQQNPFFDPGTVPSSPGLSLIGLRVKVNSSDWLRNLGLSQSARSIPQAASHKRIYDQILANQERFTRDLGGGGVGKYLWCYKMVLCILCVFLWCSNRHRAIQHFHYYVESSLRKNPILGGRQGETMKDTEPEFLNKQTQSQASGLSVI